MAEDFRKLTKLNFFGFNFQWFWLKKLERETNQDFFLVV